VRDLGGVFVEAVRAARMAMVLTDPALPGDPIVFANQAFLELSGYARDEVLGQGAHFMNGPDTDPDDAARFAQILADDEDGVVETIQYAKDGRRFVATVLLSAFKDSAGQTIHHFLTWADVTRRVEAETKSAALAESEEREKFLLALGDALQALSDAADIQATTARMVGEHLGVDRAMYGEIEGAPGEEAGIIRGQFVRPSADGAPPVAPFPERFTFETYGGHTMAARYRGEPLVVADVTTEPGFSDAARAAWVGAGVRAAVVVPLAKSGRLVAEFGVHSAIPRVWTDAEVSLIRDVAERTWAAAERARAEAAVRESEEKYAALFAASPAPVLILKPDAPHFTIADVNDAYLADPRQFDRARHVRCVPGQSGRSRRHRRACIAGIAGTRACIAAVRTHGYSKVRHRPAGRHL
jgi:PAS domain S-box-containing protein